MFDLSIEYSLNTPVFSAPNILEQKIFDLVRNNNMGGGGYGLDMSNCISLLIGLIIIIIGCVLLWFKNDLVEAEGIITSQSCDEGSVCKITITYIVDSTQYSKIISMNKNNIPDTSTIKIYYQSLNPNEIQLYNPNYSIIGIGMIIIGVFIIIFSMGSNNTNSSFESSGLVNTDSNLYSNSINKDGLVVVYNK